MQKGSYVCTAMKQDPNSAGMGPTSGGRQVRTCCKPTLQIASVDAPLMLYGRSTVSPFSSPPGPTPRAEALSLPHKKMRRISVAHESIKKRIGHVMYGCWDGPWSVTRAAQGAAIGGVRFLIALYLRGDGWCRPMEARMCVLGM